LFRSKQYYTKDQNLWTHTTLGPCIDDDGTYINSKGKFNIPIDKKQELIDILYDVRFVHKKPVFLSEKPQQHTLIKADFDFKYNLDHGLKRTHTLETIKQIVSLYNSIIIKYLNVTSDKLNAFIFERIKPYQDNKIIKDGIHLIYPNIVCDTD